VFKRLRARAVVERQWTSNVIRKKATSSHLLLAQVGKFVIVSAAAFHDLDKALRDKNTFSSLLWPIALKESMTTSISSSTLSVAYWCWSNWIAHKNPRSKKNLFELNQSRCLNTSWTTLILGRREYQLWAWRMGRLRHRSILAADPTECFIVTESLIEISLWCERLCRNSYVIGVEICLTILVWTYSC